MRKLSVLLVAAVMTVASLCGCGSRNEDAAEKMDNVLDNLEYRHNEYLKTQESPKSVLDTLDLMLDHFVSGLSAPAPSSIPSISLDPGDRDAQDLISGADSSVADERELEELIHKSLKNIETDVSFTVNGSWLTLDLMYEIVFERVRDKYMLDAFGLASYCITWTSSGANTVYDLSFDYIDGKTPEEILHMREEIDNRSKQIIRDLDLGGKSEYEIITAIDQYLCDNVYYPDKPYITNDYNPYGAMIDGRAVCEGYARSVKILCELCAVDCYYVTGYCDNDPVNGAHAWNLVKIDGKWYQLDTTWNDGGNCKDYFLVTDDFMTLSRVWDKSDYPVSDTVAYTG